MKFCFSLYVSAVIGFGTLAVMPLQAQFVSLLPEDSLSAFVPSGFENGQVREQGQGSETVLRVETETSAVNPWDVRLIAMGRQAVEAGDQAIARFRMRLAEGETGSGYARFVVEANSAPYAKSAEWSVRAGSDWEEFEIPFKLRESYAALLYSIQLWFPHGPQVVEIADFTVEALGDTPIEELGLTAYPYAGHEADAAWRAAAQQRIENIRKRDLSIVIRDSQGHPVPNAPVHIRMQRHGYGFGTAVDTATLLDNSADGEMYRERFLELFNAATLENDLKWFEWEADRTRALAGLGFLQTAGITDVHGHNLVWPGWDYLPGDVVGRQNFPDQIRDRVNDHITEVASATQGLVSEWDVINEPVVNRDLQKLLGEEAMVEWMQLARAADPEAVLFVNEAGVLNDGAANFPRQDALIGILSYLKEQGAPLQAIGLQAHIDAHLTPPEELLTALDLFASLGLPLEITEFDVALDETEEDLQAQYAKDFLTAAFSHPATRGFTNWGFWAGRHWRPEAAMFRQDWTPKPWAEAWRELVLGEWWSDVEGVTDENGVFTARVFLGDYEVETELNGEPVTLPYTHSAESSGTLGIGNVEPGPLAPTSILSDASRTAGPIAAGQLIWIQTDDFGPEPDVLAENVIDAGDELPLSLAGRAVYINGSPAPVLKVTANSILAEVPAQFDGIATVELELFGARTNAAWLPVGEAVPAVFTLDGSGSGQAVARDGNGTLNTTEHRAAAGSSLTLQATGLPVPAGVNLRAQSADPVALTSPVLVLVGGVAADVESALWVAPGISEITFTVPEGLPAGSETNVQVGAAGQISPAGVTVAIE